MQIVKKVNGNYQGAGYFSLPQHAIDESRDCSAQRPDRDFLLPAVPSTLNQ